MMVDLYMRLAIRLIGNKNDVAKYEERTESTFKKVYRFFKNFVYENLMSTYDEAYLCCTLACYLESCSTNKVQDQKLNKFVPLVVIFLLKIKSFHQDPKIKLSVLELTNNLSLLFPLCQGSPLDQINLVLGLLPALSPTSQQVLTCT